MRNLIVALVGLNAMLLLMNLFVHLGGENDPPLLVEGVPALKIAPETPGSVYSASKSSGVSSCFTIGPYYSEKAAQLVAGNIRSFGLEVTIRGMNSKETLNYLVYIPNVPDQATADKITKDLAEHNAGSYDIVQSGPYKNTITFGFFNNLDKAKRKTEYIRYLGYDAKYNSQKVMRKVYWVDYDEPMGTATPALEWSKNVDPGSNVQVIPRTCDQHAWYGSGAFAESAITDGQP